MDVWDDKATGQKRSKLKVVADNLQFLPDGKGGARPAHDGSEQSGADHSRHGGSPAPMDDYPEEDDIPF